MLVNLISGSTKYMLRSEFGGESTNIPSLAN